MTATYELASSTRTKLVLKRARAPFIHLEFRKAYSKANGFNLGILSAAAYMGDKDILAFLFGEGKGTLRKAAFLKAPNVSSCFQAEAEGDFAACAATYYFLKDGASDTQAFTYRTGAYRLIACRGTESNRDILNDLNAHRVPFHEGVGLVHEGFYDSFRAIRQDLDLQLDGDPKDLPVICCGHSLGGALATLVAAYVRRKHRREALLYTYGCPIVGDSDFANHFTSKEPVTAWRHVQNRDVVTMIPTANMNLRVHLLPLALAHPLWLLPATTDASGKPYTHLGKLVFMRRAEGGAFSVDVDRKTPAYLRLPDDMTLAQVERPRWEQLLNKLDLSAQDHFIDGYVSILGSELKQAVHASLATGDEAAANVRKMIAYLETEVAALEKAKAKAEKDALLPTAPVDASGSGQANPAKLTPAEKLRLTEDALRDKLMERTLMKARLGAVASPAYRAAVLKEILDRPISPSLRKEFEYQDKNLKY